MSLARFFFKPRWQSKDETVRRNAVAGDDQAELIAALPRLAREDVDASVRIAALKRLADPALAQALAKDDRDENVRKFAQALWTDLLTGNHAAAPTLTERIRLLRAQDDVRLIEHMAQRAPEAELRLAAIQRVTRPALLVERATTDTDSGVRLAALDLIADETLLARIAERARKTDKKISRLANDKLDALRLERGDAAAIDTRARTLSERLERVLREGEANDTAAVIATAWAPIADKVSPELRTRYTKARELFDLSRDPQRVADLRQRVIDREQMALELTALERDLTANDAIHNRESLTARFVALTEKHAALGTDASDTRGVDPQRLSTLVARLAELETHAQSEPVIETPVVEVDEEAQAAAQRARENSAANKQRQREQQEVLTKELEQAVADTEKAIESGNTAQAHATWSRVPALRKKLGAAVSPELRRRLADVEAHYGEIAQWQRWSDNQRREQLCEEIEALPSAGLHPDALATRVREAQTEWAKLDKIENRPANAADGMSRRFRALCREAIAPAKPYFEKRDELRKLYSQQISELIARATVVPEGEVDWRAVSASRKEVTESLRGLDRVDPRERKVLAQNLKDTLTAIDARIAARDAAVEAAKSALINDADALLQQADVRSAISGARDLQKRWQGSGNGRRSRDEAQWRAFRKAIDAVFARADSERAQRTERDQQSLTDAANLCDELEQISVSDATIDRAAVSRIEQAWNALGVSDNTLRTRFQTAQNALRDLQTSQERVRRRERFDLWSTYYALCRKLERSEIDSATAEAEIAALPALEIANSETQARLRKLLSNETIQVADVDAVRDCVLEIEQLAGLDSPPEDRQRRLDLQVGKLAARMRGSDAASPAIALHSVLSQWIEIGPIPNSEAALESRYLHALEHALKTLI